MLVSQENGVPTRLHHLSHSVGSCIYFCILNAVKQLQKKGADGFHLQGILLPQEKGNVVVFICVDDFNV